MPKVTDPVCQMEIKIEGQTYYFRTNACLRQFEKHPEEYVTNEPRRPG